MAIHVQLRQLLNLFIILFLIISGYLVYWQMYWPQAQADQYQAYRQCIAAEQPIRGRIFDRNGVLLAWSEPDPNVFCGWRRRYATHDYPATADHPAIKGHPSISTFLGYFSYTYGSTGLERYYNALLTGQNGGANVGATAQQFWDQTLHRRVHGQDLYLGIDIRIQDYADSVFFDQVKGGGCTNGSSTGSIIVQDPRNGQILAIVSRPYYNADAIGDPTPAPDNKQLSVGQEYWNTINSDPNSPTYDRAIQGQYPPGSSFKTMTLIAGIDSGAYTLNSTFTQDEATTYTVNGVKIASNNLGDYTHGPEPPSFPLQLGHAYAYSDNVVFARVGVKTGADTWLKYAKGFGMSTPDAVQALPVDTFPAGRSDIYRRASFPPELLADSAFGQGELFVSPLTMSMMATAVAADGQAFAPRFLMKSVLPDSRNPSDVAMSDPNQDPTSLGQLFNARTALQVRQAMRDVVVYGSIGASGGPIAAIKNLPMTIGGKTGTAQLSSGDPHAWFISLANDNGYGGDAAKMTVVIMKERGGEGACQAPIAGKIDTFALPLVK